MRRVERGRRRMSAAGPERLGNAGPERLANAARAGAGAFAAGRRPAKPPGRAGRLGVPPAYAAEAVGSAGSSAGSQLAAPGRDSHSATASLACR